MSYVKNEVNGIVTFKETDSGFEETQVLVNTSHGITWVAVEQAGNVVYLSAEVVEYIKTLKLA